MQYARPGGGQRQYIPIAAVVPYRRDHAFKARVIEKSQPRSWSNDKGTGTVFTITFMDSNGDTMQGKFWNQAYEKFYNIIQQDKVYELADGRVGVIQQRGGRVGTTSEYDVTFDEKSTIVELPDTGEIPRYSTKKIATLESISTEKDKDELRDYQAVVHSYKPVNNFMTKNGKQSSRRDIQLIDRSACIVDLTLWGEQANLVTDAQLDNHPVIIVHNAKINEFNNARQLQSSFTTSITTNVMDSRGKALKQWYDSNASSANFTSLKDTMSQANGAQSGPKRVFTRDRLNDCTIDGDEFSFIQQVQNTSAEFPTQWLEIDGYVSRLSINPADVKQGKGKPWYEACPNEIQPGKKCSKKVISSNNMSFSCERCNKEFPSCDYRYILNMQIADEDGSRYVTLFDLEAQSFLGKSAAELNSWLQEDPENGADKMQAFFESFAHKPIHALLMGQLDSGQNGDGQQRIRWRAQKVNNGHLYSRLVPNVIAEIRNLMKQKNEMRA